MWKYVKMFRLNRIPSGIWPMLTNSRLLQIGMQPTVAIVFAMHFKRESYQGQLISVQSSMATLKIWFTICCFRRATQPGKTIPKGWYQRSAYFKEMGLLFLWVFFQKKQYPWCWYQHGSLQQNSNGFAPIFRPWGWATCQGPSVFHVSFQSRLVAFPSTGLGKWSVASTGVYGLFSGSQL